MEFIQTSGPSVNVISAARREKKWMPIRTSAVAATIQSCVHTAKELRIIQKYVSGPQRSPATREQSGRVPEDQSVAQALDHEGKSDATGTYGRRG